MSPRVLAPLLAAALGSLVGRAAAARVSPGLEEIVAGDESMPPSAGHAAASLAQANVTVREPDPEALLEEPELLLSAADSAAGLARANATAREPDPEALLEEGGALLDHLTPVTNDPTTYEHYIKEISRAIIFHDEGVLNVANYDGSDNKVRDGTILFNMVGTCPSGWLCGDQAVTVADFGGDVMAYWSKPHGENKECTRSRHVKGGKCKNDSGKFQAMEQLFRGGGNYYVERSTKRAVVEKGGEQLYVYLVYVTTWNTWSGTMDGWLLYQKIPNGGEFFRMRFQSGKDAKFNFRGGSMKLNNFWPAKWEMDLP